MLTKQVSVTQAVKVSVDESKFTPEFMAEFRQSFYNFDTVDDHIEHLGQLFARGLVGGYLPDEFIEGYGPAEAMGIHFYEVPGSTEVEITA